MKHIPFLMLTAGVLFSTMAKAATFTPWVDGISAKNHNSQGDGFNAYSHGIAGGIDLRVMDTVTLKLGYARTLTDVKTNGDKTKIAADNYFITAKYQPSRWYVSGQFNYGHGAYTYATGDQGNVDTYAGELMAGFEIPTVDNYSGFRYAVIRPEVADSVKNTHVLTAVIGTRMHQTYVLNDWLNVTPELRMAGTYDIQSDGGRGTIYVPNGYTVYGAGIHRLRRAAFEAGMGVQLETAGLKISLGYDINWRTANFAQSGKIKLQCDF